MTRIYIARHGQDEDNAAGILNGHRDRPLTALGLGQAKELAGHIKDTGISFDKIYASPLQRAYTTAETVADMLGMEKPESLALLIERNFGVMAGKKVADIAVLCGNNVIQAEKISYFLSPEGAETFPDLLIRGQAVLNFLADAKNSALNNILLVCHGDIGKMIYGAFYGHSWEDMLTKFHFGNSELLLLDKNSDPDTRHVLQIEQHN